MARVLNLTREIHYRCGEPRRVFKDSVRRVQAALEFNNLIQYGEGVV